MGVPKNQLFKSSALIHEKVSLWETITPHKVSANLKVF